MSTFEVMFKAGESTDVRRGGVHERCHSDIFWFRIVELNGRYSELSEVEGDENRVHSHL